MRKHGLKVGFYFSHLDWSHPDYATITRKDMIFEGKRNEFSFPKKGEDDIFRWEKFLEFHRGQLRELSLTYQPDLYWFDGDWEREEYYWRMKELRDSLLSWQPSVVLNSRMRGYGDYETPERSIPISLPDEKWELCMTMNGSWGYRHSDTNYKSPREIIQSFVDVIALGGNLLLDVGPKEDGTIPEEQIYRLQELGNWIKKHEEAVYPTQAGIPFGHFNGPTTLSKDKKTLFLYLYDIPQEFVSLKGLRNKPTKITVVGTGEDIWYNRSGGSPWVKIPGVMRMRVPKEMDKYVTVIKIECDEPISLYHGPGYNKYEPCEH
jgi:alpha-L-fucosidase